LACDRLGNICLHTEYIAEVTLISFRSDLCLVF
jgi:hypothetical protein